MNMRNGAMTQDQQFLLQQLDFILTDCDFTGRELGSSNLAMSLLDDIESIVQSGHDEELEASGEPFDPRYDGLYAGEQRHVYEMPIKDDDIPF